MATKKLLIADDEDAVRNGLCKYIQLHTDRFEKIYTAENGQKALDLIVLHRPDIMLLDVRMPLKSGVEVMQEASAMGIMPVTIVLSGYDEFQYAQQAIHYGARDYLLKPTRSSDILALLNKIADEIYGKEQPEAGETTEAAPAALVRAEQYIREHYHEDISAQQAAEYEGITAGYLSTLFSQYRDYGFSDFVNSIRIDRACTYLEQGYLKNYEIAYKVGYRDEKYFSKTFKKVKGISPGEYKKKLKET
ncbi:MAG: response regulator [Lachnospiraceae bacterium]|nr:response regulator [Lachnospiraceae bacterium]